MTPNQGISRAGLPPEALGENLLLASFFFFLIEVQLIYNVVPISALQQSDSVIHKETFFF